MDRPNIHRAVELAVHTVPLFGHAKLCSEMVMEMFHQIFKGWLQKNRHETAHLTAVERALARDWMGRVYSLYMCWKNGDSKVSVIQ